VAEILALNKISNIGTDLLDKSEYSLVTELNKPDAIILRSYNMHDMELPESLKCVARAGAGVNNIPIGKCSEKGIVVFNTPGANANAVKELVLAGLLMSSRKIYEGIKWSNTLTSDVAKTVEKGKSNFGGHELAGKTIGIVGLGAIGVLVADICLALGMNVIGHDPMLSVGSAWKISPLVKRAKNIDTLYAESDFITLHIPYMDSTKNIINAGIFGKLKDGVKLLNFSRGELVNNEDLKTGLESKKIAYYITDFPCEALLNVENVITIPHLGASTEEAEDNCAVMAIRQMVDFLEEGSIHNSVNFPNCQMPRTTQTRICVFHKNIPDVIGSVTKIISSKKINIENMLNKSKGDYAYTILDVSEEGLNGIVAQLNSLDAVIKVRVIQ
jgi:D-3-phosphoglycerate dehydrogenase